MGHREQLEGLGRACSAARSALWFADDIDYVENLQQLFTYNGGHLRALAGELGAVRVRRAASARRCWRCSPATASRSTASRAPRFAFSILLGAVMVPATALVIPTFILFSRAGLTNTIWAVILPSLLNPFGVYLMNVYARDAVPDELLDAARVDGAGEFRTFFQVALPLHAARDRHRAAAVGRVVVEQLLPAARDAHRQPALPGHGRASGSGSRTASTYGAAGTNLWSLIILGSLVSIIPLIIAFLSLQRYWRGGLAVGSLK